MFSVVIPLYNKAAYFEKAINSVLTQTYSELEVIIVNDGSTDDSFAQLSVISCQLSVEDPESFKKIRIIDQTNQGVSVARNNGVKLAKYDYIAFLDADDWWEPTYLEEMKGLIEKFPEAGLYGSSYYKVKQGKFIPANIGVESGFSNGLINYCRVYAKTMYQPIWTGAAVIRKSVYESENGFNPTLKLGEDFDLWLRVAMKCPVALLNKPLAYYNQDVEQANRAIGDKLYEPEQHMLFADYRELNKNPDFRYLFEVLALYGLLPYYLTGKNKNEVCKIISDINWISHPFKYRLYYKILPSRLIGCWFKMKDFAYKYKIKL